jgi:hypothetical protein
MPKWRERPEDVLESAALAEYQRGMSFFHLELASLNTILYLAEKIIEFPWNLLGRPEENFFNSVMKSFHESAVLIVTRLSSDQGMDPFTLPRFKNRVREWVKQAMRNEFDDHMKAARFDKTIETIVEKARDLRNHRYAHTAADFVAGKVKLYVPTLAELTKVKNALETLFAELSFDVEHGMLPLDYDPRVIHGGSRSHTTDIEELLDSVAKNSYFFNMPEANANAWQFARTQLTAKDLAKLNSYRLRFGMPQV